MAEQTKQPITIFGRRNDGPKNLPSMVRITGTTTIDQFLLDYNCFLPMLPIFVVVGIIVDNIAPTNIISSKNTNILSTQSTATRIHRRSSSSV